MCGYVSLFLSPCFHLPSAYTMYHNAVEFVRDAFAYQLQTPVYNTRVSKYLSVNTHIVYMYESLKLLSLIDTASLEFIIFVYRSIIKINEPNIERLLSLQILFLLRLLSSHFQQYKYHPVILV